VENVNESKFLNVRFLARQILGIPSSLIGTEQIFSIAGVLTSLQQCHIRVENLDKLVMIYKNWPIDVQVDCKLVVEDRQGEFFVAKNKLLEENEELLEKASYFKKTKSCVRKCLMSCLCSLCLYTLQITAF
jgi:hypothetical protein